MKPVSLLVRDAVVAAVLRAADELGWGEEARRAVVEIDRPKDPQHGDYATNVALRLARPLRLPPLEVARAVALRVATGEVVTSADAAAPGFVNLRLSRQWLAKQVEVIVAEGEQFGRSDALTGQRIQVEYISANPTGPMTIANARGGPIGDVLANVLAFQGAHVTREFYVDDSGTQTDALGRSVAIRYRELAGDTSVPFPEDGYLGEYVADYAARVRSEDGDRYLGLPFEEQAAAIAERVLSWVIEDQRRVAEKFGIHFDEWYTESSLLESGYFDETVAELRARGAIEDRDGAVWLRSTDATDDKEGYVVIRSNGEPTYFGKDIAYHRKCLVDRGFDRKIDVWGANTHGHMRKMKQAMQALEIPLERWEVLLYQYVRFVHEGVLTRMGKRTGKFLLLEDVIDAVGVDVARYFFLQASADRHLDFDFEVAVARSTDNPAYYVQYAHARIASICRAAAEKGLASAGADVSLLGEPAELEVVKKCLELPDLIAEVVATRGVHKLTHYALELAGSFHGLYRDVRVVTDDAERSRARLRLVEAVQLTLRQVLGLLGVSAPETM